MLDVAWCQSPFFDTEIDKKCGTNNEYGSLLRSPKKPSASGTHFEANTVNLECQLYQYRVYTDATLREGHAYGAKKIDHEGGIEAESASVAECLEYNEPSQNV